MNGTAGASHNISQRDATAGAGRAGESKGATSIVSDEDFLVHVLQSDKPVFVDFWAEWCPPCHMVAPVLDEIADEYPGVLSVAKVNVDENRDIALDFGVRALPTIAVFNGGDLVERFIGTRSRKVLLSVLAAHCGDGVFPPSVLEASYWRSISVVERTVEMSTVSDRRPA